MKNLLVTLAVAAAVSGALGLVAAEAVQLDWADASGEPSLQDGVEVYVFVAKRGGRDLGYDGPHRLTRANAAVSIAEYRRRVSQQHGSDATVRAFQTRGSGTCIFVYRHEANEPGRILAVTETSRINADGRVRRIRANGGTIDVSPQCAP